MKKILVKAKSIKLLKGWLVTIASIIIGGLVLIAWLIS